MSQPLQAFVSSMCYELRDLRAAVGAFLESLGLSVHMSEEPGFPYRSGDKPYITTLRTVETSQLVVGILEHQYGTAFDDWGPYPEYRGLSPTHAEFRHALRLGKRFLLYVHQSTLTAYEIWKADPGTYANQGGRQAEPQTLTLLHELMTKTDLWREGYRNASDVTKSLQKNLINELYWALSEREKRERDQAEYFKDLILNAAPPIRLKVQEALDPELVSQVQRLETERSSLEQQLATFSEISRHELDHLREEKQSVDDRLGKAQEQLRVQQVALTMAATRDANWIHAVRTQLMPKQPGRVPFHNALEVALRGYNVAGAKQQPTLSQVTWSPLTEVDEQTKLHRGYRAGIIFHGNGFSPGITWTVRRKSDPSSSTHPWQLPNIYFGDYLEVSTHDDPVEGPLGWRGYEFAVRNPSGETSDWVEFSYPFDLKALLDTLNRSAADGRRLFGESKFAEAVEPSRKAWVFADRLLGPEASETLQLRDEWNRAIDAAARARLRFNIGDQVIINRDDLAGSAGVVKDVRLRHLHAYTVTTADGQEHQVQDDELSAAP